MLGTPQQSFVEFGGDGALMSGCTDLVLLEIDETRLAEPPRWEPSVPSEPESMRFPHVYGPIPLAAVVAVHDFPPDADGRFHLPPGVAGRTR